LNTGITGSNSGRYIDAVKDKEKTYNEEILQLYTSLCLISIG